MEVRSRPHLQRYDIEDGTCRCRVLYHIDSRGYLLKKLEYFMTAVPVLCVQNKTQHTHLNGEKNDNTL